MLTVYHNEDFSPDASNKLTRIEDMLIRTVLSSLPRCKLCMYIEQSFGLIWYLYFNFHCQVGCTIFFKVEIGEVS